MKEDNQDTFQGFAVLTDEWGTIKKVLRIHPDFTGIIEPGKPLSTVVEHQSVQKFLTFLVTLRREKALFNWDLNVLRNGKIVDLYFIGGLIDGDSLIVASKSTVEAGILYEEFLKINNEQTDILRATLKQHAKEQDAYLEMTKLNNEMLNLQRDLQKKNSQLQRVLEERNQFIGMAAHDLRNPLGGVLSMAEILLEGECGPVTEEQIEYLGIIQETTAHMLEIVNQMLEITKIDSGKLELYYSDADLIGLIKRTISLNEPKAAKKEIAVHFDPPIPELHLTADQAKILQVLDNLLTNAIKFSHRKTNITIIVKEFETEAEVTVEDEGQGIPEEELPKLFTPFAKISVTGTSGEQSTGLGLAICKQIIEGHGGAIRVRSVPQKGSSFRFTLPLEPGPSAY